MIGAIIIPYSFSNNTEVADAVKVNADFAVAAGAINELVAAYNNAQGTRPTLADRLAVSLNDDGSIKAEALPVGTYDVRTKRTVSSNATILNSDSVIKVDTTAGNVTVTMPPSASATVMPTIINIGLTGYSVIIMPDTTDTIQGIDQYVLSLGGEFAQFDITGTNWWRIR